MEAVRYERKGPDSISYRAANDISFLATAERKASWRGGVRTDNELREEEENVNHQQEYDACRTRHHGDMQAQGQRTGRGGKNMSGGRAGKVGFERT